MYYFVLFSSLDLCAAYYDYFAEPTQILCAPWNTDEIGGRRHLPPLASIQYPMVSIPICLLLPSTQPPCPSPFWSLWPVIPVRPVIANPFLPYGQATQRPNFSKQFDDPDATPKDKYHESNPDSASSNIYPFVSPLYRPCLSRPVIIRYTQRQFLPYQPLLLLIPPHLIIHIPHTPLPPENLPLPILMPPILTSFARL